MEITQSQDLFANRQKIINVSLEVLRQDVLTAGITEVGTDKEGFQGYLIKSPVDAIDRFDYFKDVCIKLIGLGADQSIVKTLLDEGFSKYQEFLQEYSFTDPINQYKLTMFFGVATYMLGDKDLGIDKVINTDRPDKSTSDSRDLKERVRNSFGRAEINAAYNHAIVDMAIQEIHQSEFVRAEKLYQYTTEILNTNAPRYYVEYVKQLIMNDRVSDATKIIEQLQSIQLTDSNAMAKDMTLIDSLKEFISISAQLDKLEVARFYTPNLEDIQYKSFYSIELAKTFVSRNAEADDDIASEVISQILDELNKALDKNTKNEETEIPPSVGRLAWMLKPENSSEGISQRMYDGRIREIIMIVKQSDILKKQFEYLLPEEVETPDPPMTQLTEPVQIMNLTSEENITNPAKAVDKFWYSLQKYLYSSIYDPTQYNEFVEQLRTFHQLVTQVQNSQSENWLEKILQDYDPELTDDEIVKDEEAQTLSMGQWKINIGSSKGVRGGKEYEWNPSPFLRLFSEISLQNNDLDTALELVRKEEMHFLDKMRIILLVLEKF